MDVAVGTVSWAELSWIPVGAGTRFQRASLVVYESVAALLSRRGRQQLVHGGLCGSYQGLPFTLELMPAPAGPPSGEVTGPVGTNWAGRLRLFRYQVCLLPDDALPDQAWAVAPPTRLTEDPAVVAAVMELSKKVPAYTWGRRRRGHPEMWTSDSAVAWILTRAGVELQAVGPPPGCRAPGWRSGIVEARGGPDLMPN